MSSLDSSAPAPGCLPRPSARWWWPRSSEQKKRRGFCGGWSFGSLNSCKKRKERHYINEWEWSVCQACRGEVGRLTWSGRIFRGRRRGRSGTARVRWAPNKTDSSPSGRKKMRHKWDPVDLVMTAHLDRQSKKRSWRRIISNNDI